jgi:tRNA dimethylallyltransferase
MEPCIVCLMGPTASGKTDLALELIQYFPFEIISVDSAMIYRGMNIGTAKPDPEILSRIPHHLIDICDPNESYSAAKFKADAENKIKEILSKGKIPLLVGGTMLYFRTLQQGIAALPEGNATLRRELLSEGTQYGWEVMHERLSQMDPDASSRIHPHDRQRIQRALEVYLLTGKNLTTYLKEQSQAILEDKVYNIILEPLDRALLHERIATRFKMMLEKGLVDEVQDLKARFDLNNDMPAMRSVGYRQVSAFLEGQCSFDEMCEKGIIATRQLAKRQLTWLRSWPLGERFVSEDENLKQGVINYLLSLNDVKT